MFGGRCNLGLDNPASIAVTHRYEFLRVGKRTDRDIHVTVYASNGRARNNVGRWPVKNIPVAPAARGFEFFRQKDIAMANDADIGFMIWDGKSRGTLCNILTLAEQWKRVLVYLHKYMM